MGLGDACPNAAEASRMGWATPAVGGDAITSRVLTGIGAPVSFTLPAAYLSGNGNFLRLLPDWLSSYANGAAAKNLYINVRVAKGPDAGLTSDYAPRVHVHEVNATMVGAPPFCFSSVCLCRCVGRAKSS